MINPFNNKKDGQGESVAAGSGLMLDFSPLKNISESLCALHIYPDDPKKQLITYHFCSCIDENRRQCLLYDSSEPKAKLIGVEYIISEKLFSELPEEEKKFWHSHKFEVESGLLVMNTKSMVPEAAAAMAEKPALEILVNTYGKTWQLWPVDDQGCCSSVVPTGVPKLLMSYTDETQINEDLLQKRDNALGISTQKKREERTEIKGNKILDGADQWVQGKVWQVKDE